MENCKQIDNYIYMKDMEKQKVRFKTWFDKYVENRCAEKAAKILKEERVDMKIIIKATGLTKKQIEKL